MLLVINAFGEDTQTHTNMQTKAFSRNLACTSLRPGQWPWKLESAKECVTTHLSNQLALKMDGT